MDVPSGLNIKEVDEYQLYSDPESVEERQVPMLGQVLPGNGASKCMLASALASVV